jgi:hypothetical protein
LVCRPRSSGRIRPSQLQSRPAARAMHSKYRSLAQSAVVTTDIRPPRTRQSREQA